MSSFLHRMAERALGQAQVVRPLVAPRYASPEIGAPASPLLEGDEEREASRQDAAPASQRPVPPANVSPSSVQTEVQPAPRVETELEAEVSPSLEPPAVSARAPAAARAQVSTGLAPGRSEPSIAPSPAPTPVAPAPFTSTLPSPVAAPRIQRSMAPPEPSRSSPAETFAPAPSSRGEPRAAAPTGPERPIAPAPAPAEPALLAPLSQAERTFEPLLLPELEAPEPLEASPSSFTRPAAPAASATDSSRGERTVRITIGRIDVHAAPPAPAPRAQPSEPRKSPLSLEEYLEKRQRRPR